MMTPNNFYIHIPLDIFDDASNLRCPTTVNLELHDSHSQRRRSVGVYPTPRNTPVPDSACMSDMAKEVARKNRRDQGSPNLWGHVKKKVPVVGRDRNMDTDDEGSTTATAMGYDAFDVIDAVAHANDISAELNGEFLPQLRASPCQMHNRNMQKYHLPLHHQQHIQRSDARNDLLYATSYHGGHNISNSGTPRRSPPGSTTTKEESRVQMERDMTFQRDMLAGRTMTYQRPALPKEMTSSDFVTTWLEHGSAPQGKSHFPEIVPNGTILRNSPSQQHSKLGKKQDTPKRRKSKCSHISE